MKRRVLAIAALAIVALSIALACGSNPIVVATIIKCQMPDAVDAGAPGETCPAGQFCSATPSCGSKDGLCEKIEEAQCATMGPECGCNGVSYLNRSLREAARISLGAPGACDPRTVAPVQCTSTRECREFKGAVCGEIIPLVVVPDIPDAGVDLDGASSFCQNFQAAQANLPPFSQFFSQFFAPRFCWVVPDVCPTQAPRTVVGCDLKRCVDECSAIKDGGIFFRCPPDASAD